jgi:hypothetical protein
MGFVRGSYRRARISAHKGVWVDASRLAWRHVVGEVLRGCAVGVEHSRQQREPSGHWHGVIDHGIGRRRVDLTARTAVEDALRDVPVPVDVDVDRRPGDALSH